MASIKSTKKKIFGFIAAAKLIAGDDVKIPGLDALSNVVLKGKSGLPKVSVTNSFPSINNGGDPIVFLTDLIKSLIGFDALLGGLTDMLTYSIPSIIDEIKTLLKKELKEIVSCGVDPSIPNFLQTQGLNVEVKKVDFFGMFKVDPTSDAGSLIYNDVTSPLTNSTDLNTFLYGVIQNEGVTYTWDNALDITFTSMGSGVIPNNTFNIKSNPSMSTKTLTDLNNNFINGLTLFNPQTLVNQLIDKIFGSVSSFIKKSLAQLQQEAAIDNVIDCMVSSDEGDEIDDSYFTFTNDEVYVHHQAADNRKKGITKLECCSKISASIPITYLTDFNSQMSGTTSPQLHKEIISKNLNTMANATTINSEANNDKVTIKLDFIQNIIQTLIKAIMGLLMSPKIIMIFVLNFAIIYGQSAIFTDAIDFIKKNKNLIKAIVKKIAGIIIKFLLVLAIKKIVELVAASELKKQTEKAKTRRDQLLSLVGVDPSILKYIQLNIK